MSQKFSKEIPISKADEEKRIVYGVVYEPDAKDSDGNWMTASEIEKMAHGFVKSLRLKQIDKNHNGEAGDGEVVESFVAREGDPDFPKGAWVLGTQITKDETWRAIKKGEITGYSIQGVGELIPEEKEGNAA